MSKNKLTPAQVTMISFVALSLLGAFALMLPISNTNGHWLGFVDAFFMSVSATCVTGLAVVHLGHDFTFFGQAVILFLMQIGGLSYMTITTILIYMAGRKLSISDSKIFDMSNNSESKFNFKDFVIKIALLTFLIEFVGVLCLASGSIKIVIENFSQYSSSEAFAIGIFPVSFIVIFNYIAKLKMNLKESTILNEELLNKHSNSEKSQITKVNLTSESGNESIEFDLNNLLFIESTSNYVIVKFEIGNKIQEKILRSSLTRIEKILSEFNNIFRCHRTYLVNIDNAKNIIGNSQGYKLIFSNSIEIPVARGKSKSLKALLKN